jgi:hypothetical protein
VNHIENLQKIKTKINQVQGNTLFITLSGSHLYGTSSPDSDYDYRGAFLAKPSDILGFQKYQRNIRISDGLLDSEIMEIGDYVKLLAGGNCTLLEQVFAKPLVPTADYLDLKGVLEDNLNAVGIFESYNGMAYNNYKNTIKKEGKRTAKKYLYVLRGFMAGIHALDTGVIEANINKLNEYFNIRKINELVDIKRNGQEQTIITDHLELDIIIEGLHERIQDSYSKTKLLKHNNKTVSNLNNWLMNTRLYGIERVNLI